MKSLTETMKRALPLLAAIFLMIPAVAQSKTMCKSGKVLYTNSSKTAAAKTSTTWICVHSSAYYQVKASCPSGYAKYGSGCRKTTGSVKRCPTGQNLCSNSYCVALLKSCKTSNKKGSPSVTCPSGYTTSGSTCAKSASASDKKCPTGWFKSKVVKGSGVYYCKTPTS